jgi:hypothetical protein
MQAIQLEATCVSQELQGNLENLTINMTVTMIYLLYVIASVLQFSHLLHIYLLS